MKMETKSTFTFTYTAEEKTTSMCDANADEDQPTITSNVSTSTATQTKGNYYTIRNFSLPFYFSAAPFALQNVFQYAYIQYIYIWCIK